MSANDPDLVLVDALNEAGMVAAVGPGYRPPSGVPPGWPSAEEMASAGLIVAAGEVLLIDRTGRPVAVPLTWDIARVLPVALRQHRILHEVQAPGAYAVAVPELLQVAMEQRRAVSLLQEYRAELRELLQEAGPRTEGERLVLAYRALCAERAAADALRERGARFAAARAELDDLVVALRSGRAPAGVVLPSAWKSRTVAPLAERHIQTLIDAYREPDGEEGEAGVLAYLRMVTAWASTPGHPVRARPAPFFTALTPAGVRRVFAVGGGDLPGAYEPPGLVKDLQELRRLLGLAEIAAGAILELGIIGETARQTRGGRPPDLAMGWLLQRMNMTAGELADLLLSMGITNERRPSLLRRLATDLDRWRSRSPVLL